MPFIAITEKAFSRLVNEQYEVLQRGIAVQRRLERLVLEERGLEEIAATISSAVGGTVSILDGRGEPLAGRGFRRELPEEAAEQIRAEALAHLGDGHPVHPLAPGGRRAGARPPGDLARGQDLRRPGSRSSATPAVSATSSS